MMNSSKQSVDDAAYMARAMELARLGRFTTTPNPNVGCVIVNDGKIVGEGYHQYAGGPHAEVMALAEAGALAAGASCYVTLEPCSHFGQTPPCADALIEANVAKVVAAMVDPNPQVSGRGLAKLAQAGIITESGLLAEDAAQLNPGFIKRMQGQGPFIRCKMACSLDGKTALSNGVSQWITSAGARRDVQQYRAQSCALISGADTVLVDNASLNVRYQELTTARQIISATQVRQPVRVIIDTQNRLTPSLKLFEQQSPIILVRRKLDDTHQWPHFVEQVVVGDKGGYADLNALVAVLDQRGFNQLWVEAGATLAGAFIEAGLVDELIIYQAAKLMGASGRSLLNLPQYDRMSQIKTLTLTQVSMVGPDIKIVASPKAQAAQE